MTERELGTCTVLVVGDKSHWSWNAEIVSELNGKRMEFSRIPMKGEFLRFKSHYFEVKSVYWHPKDGTEAMIEVVASGCD